MPLVDFKLQPTPCGPVTRKIHPYVMPERLRCHLHLVAEEFSALSS
jgi:hypothetical protein